MAIQDDRLTRPPAEVPADLRPIAEQLLLQARLAVEKAVAHNTAPATYPLPPRGAEPTLEHIVAQRLKERPASRRKRAEELVMPSVRSDAATRARRYGELASIDLRSAAPIAVQAANAVNAVTLSWHALMTSAGIDAEGATIPSTAAAPAPTPPHPQPRPKISVPTFKSLQVRLTKIKCIEETDGWGSDEMRLAGVAIEPDGGAVKIAQFQLTDDDDWDTGEVQVFNPHVLTTFDLNADNTIVVNGQSLKVGWPRTYGFTFLLAEENTGGFPAFVTDIYNQLRTEASKKIGDAVGDIIATKAGAAVGAIVGAVVQAVATWVLDTLFGELVGLFEDTEFPPRTKLIQRPNKWDDFHGVYLGPTRTSPGMVDVTADGGRYQIYYDWHFVE